MYFHLGSKSCTNRFTYKIKCTSGRSTLVRPQSSVRFCLSNKTRYSSRMVSENGRRICPPGEVARHEDDACDCARRKNGLCTMTSVSRSIECRASSLASKVHAHNSVQAQCSLHHVVQGHLIVLLISYNIHYMDDWALGRISRDLLLKLTSTFQASPTP